MDILELKLALKVAELNSFRQAAELMNMPTSKASRFIASLEYEHGHVLFKRTTRRIEVTEQGEVFLRHARIIVTQFERMKDEARELSKGWSGSLQMGYSAYTASDALPAIILAMTQEYPGINIRPKLSWTSRNLEDILNGHIDAAIVMGPITDRRANSLKLFENHIRLMVSSSHPLAGRKSVSFEDLRDQPFLVGKESRYKVTTEKLTTYFEAHSAAPRIAKTLDDSIAHEGLVRAGLGISLSIESEFAGKKRGLSLIDIEDLSESIPVSLVWLRKNTSPALANLIKVVQRMSETDAFDTAHNPKSTFGQDS